MLHIGYEVKIYFFSDYEISSNIKDINYLTFYRNVTSARKPKMELMQRI